MKRLLFVLLASALMFACGSKASQQPDAAIEAHLISEIVSNPLEFDNVTVMFEGTISHICRHSGDKMRVIQQDDDAYSVLVMLGDLSSSFSPELEGSEVIATGILKTEVMNIAALEEGHDHVHAEGEGDDHACASTQEAVAKLKEKGIDPDVRVYVELTSYEMK